MFVRFPISILSRRTLKVAISELKKGEWIKYHNKPHNIIVASSTQSGRNSRIYSLQLKPVDSESVITIRPYSTETFELTNVFDNSLRFQYDDEDSMYFSNDRTLEEITVPKRLANPALFATLEPGQTLRVRFEGDGTPLHVEGSRSVECTVMKVDLLEERKGIATLQSGLQVAVPGFIKPGDRIIVNTADRTYVMRAE